MGDVGIFTYGRSQITLHLKKYLKRHLGWYTASGLGRGDEGYGYGYAIYSGSLADVKASIQCMKEVPAGLNIQPKKIWNLDI